jgi:hypothetical protein
VAASGNSGSTTLLPSPACNTGVLAVGASYDSAVGPQPANAANYAAQFGTGFAACIDNQTEGDQIACFSGSTSRVDVIAPGAPILAPSLGAGTKSGWGTSFSSAAVSGVAALILECAPTLTPAELRRVMVSTGLKRVDPKNMLTFPVLRALDAVRSACPNIDAGTMAPDMAGAGNAPPNPDAGMPMNAENAGSEAMSVAPRERAPSALTQKYLAGASARRPVGLEQAPADSDAGSRSADRNVGGTRALNSAQSRVTVTPAAPASSDGSCSCQTVRATPLREIPSAAWLTTLGLVGAWRLKCGRTRRARGAV